MTSLEWLLRSRASFYPLLLQKAATVSFAQALPYVHGCILSSIHRILNLFFEVEMEGDREERAGRGGGGGVRVPNS